MRPYCFAFLIAVSAAIPALALAATAKTSATKSPAAKSFSNKPAPPAEEPKPICVTKKNVTLRKGPGNSFQVSWAVPKYMPLLRVERKGDWLKVVDLDNEVHWVFRKSVSHKASCAVVRTRTAKLREGPGVQYRIAGLSSVDKYTPFLKLERDGEWLQVRDDFGGTYWIHETNLWMPTVRSRMSF